jgi:hypothetical protein
VVQIIENWTDLSGRIEGRSASAVADKFVTVTLAVAEAKPVTGFANLLQDTPGQRVTIEVPHAKAAQWRDGDTVTCRVRLGGNRRIFAAP